MRRSSKRLNIIKAVIVGLIMFFGGAMTIINFHEDVGMLAVHQKIYQFFTGQGVSSAPIVSICYAAGLFFGFLFALGIGKKPNAIDLEVYEEKKETQEYNRDQRDGDI